VDAKIEFLHTGADGNTRAQAFRFIVMNDTSTARFAAAARQMIEQGFSDAPEEGIAGTLNLNRLVDGVRRAAATLIPAKSSAKR
jgi:hypothetical protein